MIFQEQLRLKGKMLKGLLIAFVAFTQLSRTFSYELQITKALKNAEKLEEKNWIYAEIKESENDAMVVEIKVPLFFQLSDVSVFFANKKKEILQVQLGKTVHGKFFEFPHKVIKEIDNEAPTVTEKFRLIRGTFPKSWLPKDTNKISAAVTDTDGTVFNYYGLRNYDVSIPDLLVVEEFADYP